MFCAISAKVARVGGKDRGNVCKIKMFNSFPSAVSYYTLKVLLNVPLVRNSLVRKLLLSIKPLNRKLFFPDCPTETFS